MLTFKNNAYLLFLFKSMLKLLNSANKLWLYKIFLGDGKSHPPKVYFFMHKNRHIIQFTLQYK